VCDNQLMSRELTVRFAVGRPDGPRGSVWRLWTRKSDVYISAWSLSSIQKISLHESGKWRHAFTAEHVSKGSPFVPTGKDRVIEKWDRPPELAPGVTRAFEIVVPTSEVTMPEHPEANEAFHKTFGNKEIVWVDPPPAGHETRFSIVYTVPEVTDTTLPLSGWPGRDSMGSRLIAYQELANTHTVWLIAFELSTTEQGKQALTRFRRQYLPATIEEVGEPSYAALLEPRAFMYTVNEDSGLRFYVDVAAAR
jgi:hypothetical protein